MPTRHTLLMAAFLLVSGGAQAGIQGGSPGVSSTHLGGGVPAASSPTPSDAGGIRFTPAPKSSILHPIAPPQRPQSATKATPKQQASTPRSDDLGTAMVFIGSKTFSSSISSKIKEISKIKGLKSSFVMHGEEPRTLVGLTRTTLKDMPEGVEFTVDIDDRMAIAQNVRNRNVIIYRTPSGAVRHYDLGSEYANFINHIDRIRGR